MSRRPVHTRRTVALLAVGALALSACGSDEEPAADVPEVDSSTDELAFDDTATEEPATDDTATEEPATEEPASGDGIVVPADPSSGTPEIHLPATAPTELVVTTLVEGTGDIVEAGDTITVHYVGVLTADGTEFDNSYKRGQPIDFPIGVGQVIAGWDRGVAGMRVGGRRQLVIPPHLAYGDRGAGSAIAPGETLIFVCDLVDVR